uniref:Toll like receptor 7 n=1 Tax=Takifugu rubripes TaxID=31033 RepID=H2T5Z4_TAKRU
MFLLLTLAWMLLSCLSWLSELHHAACKPTWLLPQFPCQVTGYNSSSVFFDCSRRHLHQVPKGITSNVTDLNLSENSIKEISPLAFSTMWNLTKLNLSWANKKTGVNISNNLFRNLTKLQHLRLSGNGMYRIPGNIPVSVRILKMGNNKITSLDAHSLAGLKNVTHFSLSRNCYRWNPCGKHVSIEKDSFSSMSNLVFLDLSFNNLSQVPKGLPQSLQFLKLDNNKIQNIYSDDFYGLQNLKELKLEGNCPRCENAPFPCDTCQNISVRIHPNAFYNLTNLETLNLGGNSLKELNPSWFERLYKLKQLFLAFNFLLKPITEQGAFLKYIPNIKKMDLSFNYNLRSYPKTINLSPEFSNLAALQTLHLEGLVFQNIGPDTLRPLYQLKNLSVLNLGTNFIIQADSSIFKKLSHLKMIYLGENRLYPIPEKNMPSLSRQYNQRLDFSVSSYMKPHGRDYFFKISQTLIKQECFDAGKVLSLNSNNFLFISTKEFEGDIKCLNLSRNGFAPALNGTEFSFLPNLTYLDLSFNKIDLAYSLAFNDLKKLQVLDLSYNPHYFNVQGITHKVNFLRNLPVLRVLNMSHNDISTLTTKYMESKSLAELRFTHNYLGTLWKENDLSYKKLFTKLTNLTILDISFNQIIKIPDEMYKHLPQNLTTLIISHNFLTDFKWNKLIFLPQIKVLDLSFNRLTNVTGIHIAHTLTLLNLKHNGISHLDDGFLMGAKRLQVLNLKSNQLTTINESTFQPRPENQFQTLYLEENPFQCTCDLLDFILWIENSDVKIPGLATDVKCDAPANQKGRVLIKFDITQCVNNSEAFLIYILTSSFVIGFMLVTTVAHLFYWDATYVLHYMKAKLKGYSSLNSSEILYGAFVTYDTRDPHVSEWVMKNLLVKLEEEGEKNLPLCLEERDWTPGVPLVDNLTQSIRYSRKTLFVLTQDYIKTGIFKMAMYLAHQRLLDENVDVIVLLLLEPVLQHSHFLRLRRRLCGESVVDWPRTAAAEPWFWQNLRNVVRVENQVMYNKNYSKYFTSK